MQKKNKLYTKMILMQTFWCPQDNCNRTPDIPPMQQRVLPCMAASHDASLGSLLVLFRCLVFPPRPSTNVPPALHSMQTLALVNITLVLINVIYRI